MTVHLINVKTGRYFQKPAQWTESRLEATSFGFASDAISFAFEKGLTDVELVIELSGPGLREIRMPLRPTGELRVEC